MSSNGAAVGDVATEGGEAGPVQQVELYVRAGHDGECLGGCPVCQRFFMILLNKADYNRNLALVVTTVRRLIALKWCFFIDFVLKLCFGFFCFFSFS